MDDPFELAECEPRHVRAGDDWAWSKPDLSEQFTPGTFTLAYELVQLGAMPASLIVSAADEGGVFVVRIPADKTRQLAPGSWRWIAKLGRVSDGNVASIGEGDFTIKPNAALGQDVRDPDEIALAQIEAVLADRSAKDVQSYAIEGRNLVKMSVGDLIRLREHYRQRVRQRKQGRRAVFPTPIPLVMR